MIALALLLIQASQAPVLAFPEPGVDDTAAYQGYQTRFYRDSRGNTVQIYLEPRGGRVVNLWADAADESLGLTVRDSRGTPVRLQWGADNATVRDSGEVRRLEYQLAAQAPAVAVGWFLLGSMRVERDFQYAGAHLRPYAAAPYYVAEESLLVANLSRLPIAERRRQLELLHTSSVTGLVTRLQPTIASSCTRSACVARIARPSLDGRNHLTLELRADPRQTAMQVTGRTVALRSRGGAPVRFTVAISTDGAALTPLMRDLIFDRSFLEFVTAAVDSGAPAARRLEREVRSFELLSSEEKLMAGLPNFATYFGRDMLMTALMMRPVWRPSMSEHVIAGVLRKLSPRGDVSHEEALGGQAIRENAAEYNALMATQPLSADSVARARDLLAHLQRTRENYHMLDDEFQLPILEARYLADATVPAERKRAFLLESEGGGPSRLVLMLRELVLVAEETRPYAADPRPLNLIAFVKRDSTHWRSASWRDSDAGYANGRFAMDINAIWAPRALEAIGAIFTALPALGIGREALDSLAGRAGTGALRGYARDSTRLRRAIATWHGARRHFSVGLAREELERRARARIAALPAADRAYWGRVLSRRVGLSDSLRFLALALDSAGIPIPIVNTDPATELFLDASAGRPAQLDVLDAVLRPYPIGLFVDGLGPLVANDAYSARRVWATFASDAYHGPRVVWGREVNLLLLALADIAGGAIHSRDPSSPSPRASLHRILDAVRASGLEHNELWSYRIEDGRLRPTRYGTSSDVQLWSSTDLAVQFMLSRLPPP